MERIAPAKQREIVALRKVGLSIPEITARTGISRTTVTRYVAGVEVPEEFKRELRAKQGGSRVRAIGLRANILEAAGKTLGQLSERDRLILLLGLYWGEGTKKDFSIINSDPLLIKTFVQCLYAIGISEKRLTLSLRIHSNVSRAGAYQYWSAVTGLPPSRITRLEIIEGKKKGKLPHGMCRVRVSRGIHERLLIQSMIALIGKASNTG